VQTLVGAIGNAQKNTVEVPDVIDDNRATATRAIEAVRLRPQFIGDATGTVAQQSPAAGSRVAAGTTVTVTMALPLVVVPNLFGQTLAQATQNLTGESLQVGDVSGPNADGSTVAQQTPLAGTHVAQGSYVAIELTAPAVTTGTTTPPPPPPPQQVVVPSLVKLSEKQAVARLTKVGLHAGDISGPGNGRVTDQSPVAGTVVDPGTYVALTLAVAPVPVQTGGQSSSGQSTGNDTSTTSGTVRIVAIAGAGVAGIVLIIAVVKIVAGAGAGKIIPPPAQVYRVVPAKPSPKTTVRGVPAIRFKLTVREVEPGPPRVAGNQPAITRKRFL
jgi:beta-lactam-binding protein with PASTA domain